MTKELTWRNAITRVLAESSQPLHYREIADRIIAAGLRGNLGATPAATVNAHISTSIRHDPDSPYVRVAKGTFSMKSALSASDGKPTAAAANGEDDEPQYDIITSFGMFWRRNAIEWSRAPQLLGVEQLGAMPVDFSGQLGIYLLYDGREAIYIGRSTDRPLGRRLHEHTLDRLGSRWDRFSWFGLRPVSDDGELGEPRASYEASKIIPALEAVLIEAFEPRQNRKRGDDLSAVEYIQQEAPELEERRQRAFLEAALDKMRRSRK